MSKGDKRRPAQITQEEMARRWELAFKQKQENTIMHNHTPDCYAHGCQFERENLLTSDEWEDAKMFGQYEQRDGDEVIFFRHVDLSSYVSMMIYHRNKENKTGESE